jgi:GMP synthase (glutamine-hydrolysing)
MKRLIIVKTGGKIASLDRVGGDYEDWIARGLGETTYPIAVVDVARGEPLPELSAVAAIVITGSASMVTERASWMEQSAAWLRQAVAEQVPLLGICFGHQLLAYALGGEVGYNPRGVEVGTATIRLCAEAQRDPLFKGVPGEFPAQVSHRQSVLRLPAGARLLATSDKELHQAFAVGACAWGIQFHPEFDARVICYFIEHYRQRLLEEGDSAERLLAGVAESPHSASLLERFARQARKDGRD